MAEFKLWGFGESGNAYKVALMMELCGLSYETAYVDFFKGETRTEAYRTGVNEMGEVPVFEHRGLRLTQSGVILDYLATLTGRFGWTDEQTRREVMRWMFFDNHKFTANIATLRFLVRFTKDPDPAIVAFMKSRFNGALKIVDKHLEKRDWIAAGHPTIADLSMCGYLFYGDELPVPIPEHVAAWAGRIRALPGWKHPYDVLQRAFVT